MRIRRQPLPADLTPEVVELVFGEPAFEERARVDAGRGVTLEEHLVAVAAVGLAAEEVVEADLVERGRRRVGGEVTAETVEAMVRAVDHHHRVPTDERADAALDDTRRPGTTAPARAGSC